MKTEVLQPSLVHTFNRFPKTRYLGSKLKLLQWISENLKNLSFDSVLDLFGGTGAVSYLFKTQGKRVTYNDNLKFNFIEKTCTYEHKMLIELLAIKLPGTGRLRSILRNL